MSFGAAVEPRFPRKCYLHSTPIHEQGIGLGLETIVFNLWFQDRLLPRLMEDLKDGTASNGQMFIGDSLLRNPMPEGKAMVRVLLPRALLEYSGGEDFVDISARTLAEAITKLGSRLPGIRERVLDDQGRVRKFVHVFVNQESVAHLNPESVPLKPGDTVHILPSVAGG